MVLPLDWVIELRQVVPIAVGQDFLIEQSNMQLDLAKMLSSCVQGECKPSKSRPDDRLSKYNPDRFLAVSQ
jgi:hypothetical protein